jgi:membrane associated rhomboid family serine protease
MLPAEITHFSELTPELAFPVILTPITSMFLHGGFAHLGGNMLYLWIFGNNIEDHMGHVKFAIFYLISGLAAVALFTLFEPNGTTPLIGASGAISGVLGAYMVMYPRARVLTLIWIVFFIRLIWLPAVFILGYWIVIQLFMALSSVNAQQAGGVAWFAHIGGFAFGWIYFRSKRKKKTVSESDYYDRWH